MKTVKTKKLARYQQFLKRGLKSPKRIYTQCDTEMFSDEGIETDKEVGHISNKTEESSDSAFIF